MKLISHADDLGLSPAIDGAIVEGAQQGRLTEVSCLVNRFSPDWQYTPVNLPHTVKLGLHFNLTEGYPILPATQVPSLVGPEGKFYPLKTLLLRIQTKKINSEEVKAEFAAQYKRFSEAYGQLAHHIDTHQHTHLTNQIGTILLELAPHYPISSIRCAKRYFHNRRSALPMVLDHLTKSSAKRFLPGQLVCDGFIDPRFLTRSTLQETLASLPPEGSYETIWHLSNDPSEAWRFSQQELLLSSEWWEYIKQNEVELTTYS